MGHWTDRLHHPRCTTRNRAVRHGAAPAQLEALEGRRLLATLPFDDRFEDNDLPRTAKLAPQGAVNSPNLGPVQGARDLAQLTLGDAADFYYFKLLGPGGPSDSIKVVGKPSSGDIDLRLLGPGGQATLASGLTTSRTETISLDGFSPGWYFIKVEGKGGAVNPTYRLSLRLPAYDPNEDSYEHNDTTAQVDAKTEGGVNSPNLGAVAATRTLNGLKLNDDYDIYKFRLTSAPADGAFLRVNSQAPLDMVLLDGAGTPVRSSEAYLGQFRVSFAGLGAGTYYIKVSHYALGTPGPHLYSLTWSF